VIHRQAWCRSRRKFLAQSAASIAAIPLTQVFGQQALGDNAWDLDRRLILASHLFEDKSFFDVGHYFRDLIPRSRQVDLWIDYAGNRTSRHFDEIRKRGFAATNAYCKQLGIRLSTATCYGSRGYAGYAEAIRDLGCTLCIQSSGKRTAGSITEMMKRELESYKPALELAEKYDCRIAIENHSGRHLLNDMDSFKAFMDLCDHPRFGIAFAPFHTQGRRESPEEFLRQCVSKVFYIYAWQQNPNGQTLAEKASGESQMPGVGPYDFGPLLQILREHRSSALISPFMHRATSSARSAELVRSAVSCLRKPDP